MQTVELNAASVESVRRNRQLYRLIDVKSSTEAAAAIRAAAAAIRGDDSVVRRVLGSVDAILAGSETAREQLTEAVLTPEFAPLIRGWMRELREVASAWPDSGGCTLATAFKLWSWTLDRFRTEQQPHVIDELIATFCSLTAARSLILSAIVEASQLKLDLAHVYTAHVSAHAAATCAELVFGYRRHLVWDAEGCATCYGTDELDELEAMFPGFASGAGTTIDVINGNGSHPAKRGPCARVDGLETFQQLRNRLDACLSGARVAKDRAASAIAGRG